jgi:1-acyl-sn-glycerol-3-phosphate acyltransferase
VTPRHKSASYRLAVAIIKLPMLASTRRDWRGAGFLPRDRGFVACANHISYADPFTFAHYLHDNGCPPRFLAKEAVFRLPVLGRIIAGAGQIPVYRESADAGRAMVAAVEAVERGECVAVYPEATLTRDPGLWPMVGKTGAARIALTTGCPVIPMAQWGPQEMLAPYGKRLHLFPRTTVQVWSGPPVDLSAFAGGPLDRPTLRAATDAILDDITRLLEQIRGEQAPVRRWDPRSHGQPVTGNPHRRRPPVGAEGVGEAAEREAG